MQPVILIADDHSMVRKGLKLIIQLDLGYADVTEVSSCSGLMSALLKRECTHLILDIILSDGSSLEVIPNIRNVYPALQVMVFSMQPADIYGEALKRYHISHYLSKSSDEEQIQKTLLLFFQNELSSQNQPKSLTAPQNPFSTLSAKELEILHYILKGIGTKATSDILNLKMSTISTIKNRIFEKTSVNNLKDLIELASIYNINY